MLRLRETSISLSIVLLALSSRALSGLACPCEPLLGLVLAVTGTAILMYRRDLGLSLASLACMRPGRRAAFLIGVSVFAGAFISTPVLKLFGWRLHEISLHRAFYYIVPRVLPGFSRSGELLTFWTGRGLEAVRLTFEGLGLYEVWYLVVGMMVFGALTGKRWSARGALRLVAVIGSYAFLRMVAITALAIELERPDLMWRTLYSIVSWFPLAGVLRFRTVPRVLSREARISDGKRTFRLTRQRIGAIAAALALGLVIAFLVGYEDPGHLKQGRVMIDEAHSDWEWADEPFDTTAYGIRAEYNYYCLREYLEHFYRVSLNSEPISLARLDCVDVLVIKTPTEPFSVGEIDAIEEFVAGGGGLLLIGDHTNLFGMSTHLNEIAERFAMKFRCDDTFDISTTGFSHYRRPQSGFHPAVREVQEFGFLTSCSVEGGMRTRPVILGCGLGSEEADYAHPNFFGNIAYDLCDRFGLFLQAGATGFGEGRVMLFSDSTCFSNFCMFSPGRCELALGMIDYLNRRGRRYPFATLMMLALLGVVGAAPFLGALRRGGFSMVLEGFASMLPFLLAGTAIGLLAMSQVNATLHGSLARQDAGNMVLFDTGHTTASFFTYPGGPRPPGVMGFEALYLCVQRIGAHPCTGRLEDLHAIKPTGVVIANPSRDFSREDLTAVDTFLREGGGLLLIESVSNGASTANQLLRPHGISIDPAPEVEVATAGKEAGVTSEESGVASEHIGSITPRLSIRGGIEVSHDESGRARIVFVQVGRGVLVVATDSFSYSHYVLGSLLEHSRPSRRLRDVYSEIYALLGNLIRDVPDPESAHETTPAAVTSRVMCKLDSGFILPHPINDPEDAVSDSVDGLGIGERSDGPGPSSYLPE